MTRRPSPKALALGLCALLCLGVGAARAEVAQKGHLRVSFSGKISPHALPRSGSAPVAVSVGGKVTTTNGANPPQLRKIEIAINSNGRLDTTGLPVCPLNEIQPSTTKGAMEACGSALVGKGRFLADVALPQQAPFPSDGEVLAFNGREGGKPVIFAHVFGDEPVPTSYTMPFQITQAKGEFGTVLTALLPQVTSDWGFVTGLELNLSRRYSFRGKAHSYLSAGCPAPKGFGGASFPFARAAFSFAGGRTLASTLTRSCGVRG